MSRAGLVSSLSTWSIVNVPASICCRSGGQGSVASLVGSPGWPTVMIRCHRSGLAMNAARSAHRINSSCRPVRGRSCYRLERLDLAPSTNEPARLALGIDETESVEAVVCAVPESGRKRMTADQLASPWRFQDAWPEKPFILAGSGLPVAGSDADANN